MSAPTHLHLAHVTLQARTPLSTGAGGAELTHDMAIVRDANGLPRIQGASIQGVLRSLWDPSKVEGLFGFQRGDEGAAGRLTVSDGIAHDKDDLADPKLRAIPGDDPVLALLALEAPLARDHVRLNHAGVVHGEGKFERLAVPVGARFSFELALWGEDAEGRILKDLIDAMSGPGFRIGGATHRGYGAVKVSRAAVYSLALAKATPSDVRAARTLPFSETGRPFKSYEPRRPKPDLVSVTLDLEPIGVWRVGRGPSDSSRTAGQPVPGGRDGPDAPTRDKAPDAVPLREPFIEWRPHRNNVVGTVKAPKDAALVVPGASVRGVLAHRTLFHFNCLKGVWAVDGPSVEAGAKRPEALVDIFGAEREGLAGGAGRAGRLFIDDVLVRANDTTAVAFDHNSIDRFTGGVRNRILFSEETSQGGKISLTLRLAPRREETEPPLDEAVAIRALNAAIADLAQGRLALGAKSLGFCRTKAAPSEFPLPASPAPARAAA